MNPALLRFAIASLLCASCVGAMAQTAAPAQAAERCEAAVAETVKRMRGRDVKDIQFTHASRAVAREPGTEEFGVKGEGRYRSAAGAVPFTYRCAYNAKTGATSAAMFREAGAAPPDAAPWQPDLSRISPQACESAAAAILKDKHPRADRIVFDGSSRKLEPVATLTALEGSGALTRAPGAPASPFTYRCEYDASGKVVRADAGG